ncbi:MAG: hypothetical protein KF802_00045 [Bdellovibrionaceae bacterium]|nr:hypothetical protein [Pseudobdellovibrionaceae bacterium]MBX3034761.1 hypothetical protein [Pseudobdellovibrionaceae bacterium]
MIWGVFFSFALLIGMFVYELQSRAVQFDIFSSRFRESKTTLQKKEDMARALAGGGLIVIKPDETCPGGTRRFNQSGKNFCVHQSLLCNRQSSERSRDQACVVSVRGGS